MHTSILKITGMIAILIILHALAACNQSKTIIYDPEAASPQDEDLSTLYPQIQRVYPGALQTLDVPDPEPTDIDPEAADIVIVFSRVMENDSGEMAANIELYRNDEYVPITVSPSTSSNFFAIAPSAGGFNGGDTYDLRIYRFAYPVDMPDYTLNFEALIHLPATTLSPVNPLYVNYRFTTALSSSADYEEPFLLNSNPGHGENDVDTTLASTGGVIVLTFFDNNNPMIYPPSVNASTVTLLQMPSTPIPINVSMEESDINFKTYYVQPLSPLANAETYILTVSVGNSIQDFRGNFMVQSMQIFSTEP